MREMLQKFDGRQPKPILRRFRPPGAAAAARLPSAMRPSRAHNPSGGLPKSTCGARAAARRRPPARCAPPRAGSTRYHHHPNVPRALARRGALLRTPAPPPRSAPGRPFWHSAAPHWTPRGQSGGTAPRSAPRAGIAPEIRWALTQADSSRPQALTRPRLHAPAGTNAVPVLMLQRAWCASCIHIKCQRLARGAHAPAEVVRPVEPRGLASEGAPHRTTAGKPTVTACR
mgnify:CR=1 FL=1